MAVAFKSNATYVENREDPKEDERYRAMREFLAADLECHDGGIIDSDRA